MARVDGYFPSFNSAANWLQSCAQQVSDQPEILTDDPPDHIDIGTLAARSGLRFFTPADAPVACVIAFDKRLRIFDVRSAPSVRFTRHATERAELRLAKHFNDAGRASRWLAAQVDTKVRTGETSNKRPGWVITDRPSRPDDIWVLVKLKSDRIAVLVAHQEHTLIAITCMSRSSSGSPKKRIRQNAQKRSRQKNGAAARGKLQRRPDYLRHGEDDGVS